MPNGKSSYSLLTTKNLKMITTDQIKAAIDRVEALYKYLNIEEKKIQLEEEELKTQAPEFWQDQKRAEAQMKLVKSLKFWIEGYNSVNDAVNEVGNGDICRTDVRFEIERILAFRSLVLIDKLRGAGS